MSPGILLPSAMTELKVKKAKKDAEGGDDAAWLAEQKKKAKKAAKKKAAELEMDTIPSVNAAPSPEKAKKKKAKSSKSSDGVRAHPSLRFALHHFGAGAAMSCTRGRKGPGRWSSRDAHPTTPRASTSRTRARTRRTLHPQSPMRHGGAYRPSLVPPALCATYIAAVGGRRCHPRFTLSHARPPPSGAAESAVAAANS